MTFKRANIVFTSFIGCAVMLTECTLVNIGTNSTFVRETFITITTESTICIFTNLMFGTNVVGETFVNINTFVVTITHETSSTWTFK